MGFSRLFVPFLLLAALFAGPRCVYGLAEDLLPEQRDRIHKLLPRTLGKLEKRAHIRVAVFGDSVSNYASRLAGENHRTTRAWHSVFLRELGDRYLYGGGVQDVRPNRPPDPPVDPTLPPPALPVRGEIAPLEATIIGAPTFFLYNYCEDSATAVQALQGLTTDAFDVPLDLVILMYGSQDALQLNPVANMRDCLEEAVKICRSRGADVVIAGPPLLVDGSKSLLARTRAYAAAARSVAANAGALFVDAGAALGRFQHPLNEDIPVAELYARQMKAIKEHYQHGEFADVVNPNRKGHERIAKVAWENLIKGEATDPLGPTGSFLLSEKEGAPSELEITVRRPDLVNPLPPKEAAPPPPAVDKPKAATNDSNGESKKEDAKDPKGDKREEESRFGGVSLTLLPVDNLWQPQTEETLEVKDFLRSRAVRQPLVMLRKPNGEGHLQNGNTVHFTTLIHEGGVSRLIDITGPMLPVTMDMPVGRLEGVAGDLLLESTVHNPFNAAFQGSLQVHWMEKTQNMDVAVDARSSKPLRLRLPLPPQANFQAPLILTLNNGEKSFRFERRIEGVRNLALSQPTALLSVDPLAKSAASPEITCKADALVFTLQVKLPPVLAGKTTTKPAARLEVAIDARGPEARGTLGYVDSLPLEIPWQDGPVAVKKTKSAVFGSGYDRDLDADNIRANVKTNRDGTRWVTLEIPRVYFYLHQWSLLESGQNTLGLNVNVSTLAFTDDAPDGRFLPSQTWKLANTTFPRRDARGLAVLELKPRPSGSWSVRVAP